MIALHITLAYNIHCKALKALMEREGYLYRIRPFVLLALHCLYQIEIALQFPEEIKALPIFNSVICLILDLVLFTFQTYTLLLSYNTLLYPLHICNLHF